MEYGTVHDERRKPGFRRGSVYDAAVSERAGESMTIAQRDELAGELAELEGPKRAEMVEAIATARGFGDLSENFAYHDAKNEQGLLERRITILRRRVENAVDRRARRGGCRRRRLGRRGRGRAGRALRGRDLERRRRLDRLAARRRADRRQGRRRRRREGAEGLLEGPRRRRALALAHQRPRSQATSGSHPSITPQWPSARASGSTSRKSACCSPRSPGPTILCSRGNRASTAHVSRRAARAAAPSRGTC